MGSAEDDDADDGLEDGADRAADDAGDGSAADDDITDDSGADAEPGVELLDDDDEEEDEPRPSLLQRLSPVASVLTTIHPQGLVIQVHRPFRQRAVAVSFERLVLDPTSLTTLRPGLLTTAGVLGGIGLLAAGLAAPVTGAALPALAGLAGHLPPWLAPTLFVSGLLVMLAAVVLPRRVLLFLDREAGLHPTFLRGGPDDAQVLEFVRTVRRAIIEFRCRPPVEDDGDPHAAPRLAATLDALLAMHAEELLTEPELAHFRELALRR